MAGSLPVLPLETVTALFIFILFLVPRCSVMPLELIAPFGTEEYYEQRQANKVIK